MVGEGHCLLEGEGLGSGFIKSLIFVVISYCLGLFSIIK